MPPEPIYIAPAFGDRISTASVYVKKIFFIIQAIWGEGTYRSIFKL